MAHSRWIVLSVVALLAAPGCKREDVALDARAPDARVGDGGVATVDPLTSRFGIFAAYAAAEFGYFKKRMNYSDDQYMDWADKHIRKLGAHWTRSNLQLFWDVVEPKLGGGYRWDNVMLTDKMINPIYSPGSQLQWLGVFHEGVGPKPKPGKPPARNPLSYPTEYATFVKAAVERYDGDGKDDAAPGVKVKYWQAGNEVMGWTDTGRTVDEYVVWVKALRKAILSADPGARLALTAPTNGDKEDPFLSAAITKLAPSKAFDVIDVHHWGAAPMYKMTALAGYRKLLDANGMSHVQIWSTEHGTWQGEPKGRGPVSTKQSEQIQAHSLVRRYVYNLNNGLDKLFWNNLMEWKDFSGLTDSIFNSMGLITDGQGPGEEPGRFNTERLAYWSYRLLAERIDTHAAKPLGEVAEAKAHKDLYGYAYRRAGTTRKLYVLWRDAPLADVSLEVGTSTVRVVCLITDPKGKPLVDQTIKATGGKVTFKVGYDPVALEEL